MTDDRLAEIIEWHNKPGVCKFQQGFQLSCHMCELITELKAAREHISQWQGAVPQSAYDSIMGLFNLANAKCDELKARVRTLEEHVTHSAANCLNEIHND